MRHASVPVRSAPSHQWPPVTTNVRLLRHPSRAVRRLLLVQRIMRSPESSRATVGRGSACRCVASADYALGRASDGYELTAFKKQSGNLDESPTRRIDRHAGSDGNASASQKPLHCAVANASPAATGGLLVRIRPRSQIHKRQQFREFATRTAAIVIQGVIRNVTT